MSYTYFDADFSFKVTYIKSIGGKDVRDFVNRSLSSLFSNELGKQCALVGQRGNLRLDGYEFIKILQGMQ